jgi:hypothetical protein
MTSYLHSPTPPCPLMERPLYHPGASYAVAGMLVVACEICAMTDEASPPPCSVPRHVEGNRDQYQVREDVWDVTLGVST